MEDCIDKEVALKWCLAFNTINPQSKRCEVLLTEFDKCCKKFSVISAYHHRL